MKGRIEQDVTHLNAVHLDLKHQEKIRAQTRSPSDIIDIQDHIIKKLKEDNQQLRDEVARLKGEKGKPKILPNVPDIPRDNSNHQAGKSKTWKKKAKRNRVKIDRVQTFCVDLSILPDDAIPKGFRSVAIQDIIWLFDSIFLSTTGYVMLDETIASTRKRKDRLLKVLIYPELPLHNNGSEIALREGVIKRKISYGTRSEAGKAAWENQLTILDTCRKQGVSYFEYILDIISRSYSMPRLSQLLIRSKSSTAY
ncbi:MAG: transposase [Methanothrix sp.]|nr:transposase [Methanothrix sp.]